MVIEQRKIETIRPYPQNAKKHTAKQIDAIAASIKEFGFNQPIVVDQAGVIIAGHGRYYAALKLKMETVPVLVSAMTEAQARAYRLADNRLNESEWDIKLVIEETTLMTPAEVQLAGLTDVVLNIGNADLNDSFKTDREGLHEMNLILTGNQVTMIRNAFKMARADKGYEKADHDGNENRNGAAMAYIVQQWLKARE